MKWYHVAILAGAAYWLYTRSQQAADAEARAATARAFATPLEPSRASIAMPTLDLPGLPVVTGPGTGWY